MKGRFFKCPACGEKSFIKEKKEYEGFTVKAVKKVCALCGHTFQDESDLNFIDNKPTFDTTTKGEVCRNCIHYAVNPWTQRCTRHNKDVTALDYCEDFEKRS